MGVDRMRPAVLAVLVLGGCAGRPEPATDMRALAAPDQDTIESTSSVLAIRFTPDSRYLAHLTQGELSLWDVLREESIWTVALPRRPGEHVDLASSTRFAIVADEGIQIWDANKGVQSTLPLRGDTDSFLLFDRNAEHLASTVEDGSIVVWNLARSQEVRREAGVEGPGWRRIRGSGFGLLFEHESDEVRVLDLGPSELDVTLEFDREPGGCVAVAFEGRSLASTNPQGSVEIRKLPEGTISSLLTGFDGVPESIALSPDGSVLAVAVGGRSVELWDTRTNERLDRMESTIWPEGGIVFSSDGYSLAWVEGDRTKVRYWSPVLGVVEWTNEGASTISMARPVCPDTASIIRFRLARGPFTRGVELLENGSLDEARGAFARAQAQFPNYPGLAEFVKLAEERYQADLRAREVDESARKLIAEGSFPEALTLFEEFLRDYGRFGDHDFQARARTLDSMLGHLDLAESSRSAGDEVTALVEFSLAVDLVPELAGLHPEYEKLRGQVLHRLDVGAEQAFQARDFEALLDHYASLARLRPLTPQALLRAGSAHENLGNQEQAVEAYEAIEDDTEQYVPAQRSLARMAKERGDLMQAKITLWQVKKVAPDNPTLAAEYAEVFQLMKDFDSAVSAWNEVARLRPNDPLPLEKIAGIEEERENWEQAGSAYHEAVRRSGRPRPLLLIRMAESFEKAGMRMQMLSAYVEFLHLNLVEVAGSGTDLSILGPDPDQSVQSRIRELGFIQHRGKWIHRDQFLSQQGWVLFNDEWVRPEEAKLREVATLYAKAQDEDLRVSTDEDYARMAVEKKISNGMTRQEVIRAWGFFNDQNVLRKDDGETVFEQLLFENSRQVYLKNGLVCFWSE